MKRNGKVEMKTLGLSAAEGIEIARARVEVNMREKLYGVRAEA